MLNARTKLISGNIQQNFIKLCLEVPLKTYSYTLIEQSTNHANFMQDTLLHSNTIPICIVILQNFKG